MNSRSPAHLRVRRSGEQDAPIVRDVIVEAFSARPVLDPPSTAPQETEHSVRAAILADGGLVAEVDGQVVGTLLLARAGNVVTLRRVATRTAYQNRGVASALADAAEQLAGQTGASVVAVAARSELPGTVAFSARRGYTVVGRRGPVVDIAKPAPLTVELPDPQPTRALGARLARVLLAGDLVLLTGDLGAGKTTLTQGIGAGLGVRGEVTSPTFVIARVHPSLTGGPALVHVDAYRLGGSWEVDDLDLEATLEDSVTVVEWGEGKVEGLAEERLQIRLFQPGDSDTTRRAVLAPVGVRWLNAVDQLVEAASTRS